MRRNKKQITTYFILFSLLLIGVVYAILQANLQINGTAKIQANTWDVHFDNIQINANSVAIGTGDSAATIDPENNCKVDFEVTLSIPGDFYEFTIDVVNAGTIDGMIGELNKTLKVNNETVSETPDYLNYLVTYADGMEILENHKLSAGVTETYKVKLEFKTDIEELPEATTISTSLEPQYIQADGNAVRKLSFFEGATWDQIIDAYSSNRSVLQSEMEAGTTREVILDMDYDGTAETTAHVRIANLSTPAECEASDFSETACGFVIEFSDIITKHRMNPRPSSENINGFGNKGGWEYSDLRAYLNSTKYLEGKTGEIDYTSTGIYNMLSRDIKSRIINTVVVSGYGPNDSGIFITTDKLYLLDAKEIYGSSFTSNYHNAKNNERQLDFYFIKNVTESNPSFDIKKTLESEHSHWWLRSASTKQRTYFFYVLSTSGGTVGTGYEGELLMGVSPAFRIAE